MEGLGRHLDDLPDMLKFEKNGLHYVTEETFERHFFVISRVHLYVCVGVGVGRVCVGVGEWEMRLQVDKVHFQSRTWFCA